MAGKDVTSILFIVASFLKAFFLRDGAHSILESVFPGSTNY